MQHIIKKQVIEIQLRDRDTAFLVQHEFHNFYWNRVIPELERIFDQLSNENEIIEIDKLEWDMGVVDLTSMASPVSLTVIWPQIIAGIKEKLRDHIAAKRNDHKGTGITRQWLHYMEKGYLDWNTMETGPGWYRQVLEGLATDYTSITLLRKLITSDKNALQRIAAVHDDIFLVHLVEVLSATRQDLLHKFFPDLERIFSLFPARLNMEMAHTRIMKHKVWEMIIGYAAAHSEGMTAEMLVSLVIDRLVRIEAQEEWMQVVVEVKAATFQQYLLRKMKGGNEMKRNGKRVVDKPRKKNPGEPGKIDEPPTGVSPASKEDPLAEKRNAIKDPSPVNTVLQALSGTLEEEPVDIHEGNKDMIDEIFARHAGLVLLHPFLSALFSRLSLLDEGRFVDASSQMRAIHILSYLARGKEDPEEYELVIPKFLTGYPLQKTSFPVILQDHEKEEALHLLEAVIDKWKIIGNTSPAGLRESFLQRKGKLYTRDEKLYLHVETGSIDVLLDHLPWNLSIIKLPWMKHLLRVDWR